MTEFIKYYFLITFINILIVVIIFANSMNFITKEVPIDSRHYVIESWFNIKGLDNYLKNLAKKQDLTQTTFYIIGRDIRSFSRYEEKLNLLNSYGLNVVEVLPERNGKDRSFKNYRALLQYQHHFETLMILTDLLHTQRAYYIANKIFPHKKIGVTHYDIYGDNFDTTIHTKENWYHYSESFKATIMEFISLVYTYIRH